MMAFYLVVLDYTDGAVLPSADGGLLLVNPWPVSVSDADFHGINLVFPSTSSAVHAACLNARHRTSKYNLNESPGMLE